jgi:tetratricopeptide (TPR) repeat protein
MHANSNAFRFAVLLSILALLPPGVMAQGKVGGVRPNLGSTSTQPTPSVTAGQALFISGRVLLEGGGPPPEPAVIERVCNGTVRRQGYTDSKGSFQFQLDQNPGFQDASETNTTNSSLGASSSIGRSQTALRLQYQGCEIRAVLAGFLSSSIELQITGSTSQYDLGTIFIKRAEDMPGTTISMTSLNAPKDAKHAYEKAQKDFDESKFSEAEKELGKAVKVYPNFAAAWSLLGDIHRRQKHFDAAVTEYKQALSRDPRFVNPSFGLALIATEEKRWQDAAELSEQVVKMNSLAFPSAYFYNAIANYNLGKLEPAEVSARKFKSLDTDHRHPDVSLLLGQIDIKKNDFGAAAQEMRTYLALAPSASNAEEVRQWLKRYDSGNIANEQ